MAYEDPIAGDDFGLMLADLFERLGFGVDRVTAPDGCGCGLIVRYPSRIRHAIAVKGIHASQPVGAPSVQGALALMQRYGAGEGWAVTDAVFAPDARELAGARGVRLIEGAGLSGLLTQATTDRGREAAVDALLAHSGFYDGEPAADAVGAAAVRGTTARRPAGQVEALREPQIQPTVQMPRQPDAYGYAAPTQQVWQESCNYDSAPPIQVEPEGRQRREASRGRSSGCRAGCVTVLVIMLVLTLFLMGMLLALPTVLDQLPLGEVLPAVKAHAVAFFEQLKDAVASRMGNMLG